MPKSPARPRTAANKEAEARYRAERESVLVRFTKEEAAHLDAAREEGTSRAEFIRRKLRSIIDPKRPR
jgi:hypothetical protein